MTRVELKKQLEIEQAHLIELQDKTVSRLTFIDGALYVLLKWQEEEPNVE
jgi:dihydrodipicolinate reductase